MVYPASASWASWQTSLVAQGAVPTSSWSLRLYMVLMQDAPEGKKKGVRLWNTWSISNTQTTNYTEIWDCTTKGFGFLEDLASPVCCLRIQANWTSALFSLDNVSNRLLDESNRLNSHIYPVPEANIMLFTCVHVHNHRAAATSLRPFLELQNKLQHCAIAVALVTRFPIPPLGFSTSVTWLWA
jgi:hypothetical protein